MRVTAKAPDKSLFSVSQIKGCSLESGDKKE